MEGVKSFDHNNWGEWNKEDMEIPGSIDIKKQEAQWIIESLGDEINQAELLKGVKAGKTLDAVAQYHIDNNNVYELTLLLNNPHITGNTFKSVLLHLKSHELLEATYDTITPVNAQFVLAKLSGLHIAFDKIEEVQWKTNLAKLKEIAKQ